MKISFITSTLHSGGSERVMSLLANSFANRGNEVEIICLNKHLVFYPIDEKVKVWFAEEETRSRSIMKKMVWLRRHVKERKPDVVIAFMLEVFCATLASLIGMRVPVVSSERIDPHFFGRAKGFLRWVLLRRTAHLVVQTERIKEFYSPRLQARTTIIRNPVTGKVFSLPEVDKENRIIAVGRLAYQKNYPMMFRAFRKVSEHFPQYKLCVYGDGPQRSEIEAGIAAIGMEDKIVLAGKSDKIIEEMNRSKLFVMSSDYEGMSNALLEAICVGLPVISTDVSGASDLIEQGINGFVTPIGDEEAFSLALEKLLGDEKLMYTMGENNRRKAGDFREDRIVDQWASLITHVVEGGERV